MLRYIHTFLISLVASTLIQGCSIENEYDEKIIEPEENIDQRVADERERDFIDLCKKCVMGDFKQLDRLRDIYFQSLRNRNFTPRFLFQREKLNSFYEACIHKAVSDGKADYSSGYVIVGPYSSALLARDMYAENRLADGAYWIRRVINLQGRELGYEIAGSVFIRDDRTYDIGVKMLGEAAHLGNRQAFSTLYELSTSTDTGKKE